ncbi:MAG: ATPase, T2SS/T4P/T4SS family [Actinomycetota bacterium]
MASPGEREATLTPVDPPAGALAGLDDEVEESQTPGLVPPRRRGHSGRFITDVLVERGYVTAERVERAISESRAAGRSPEELLLKEAVIDSDQLSRAIAERYGLDYVDLNVYQVDMAAANLVSVSSARRTRAVPVGHVDKETLLLAMADPANVLAVDDIQMATGLNCRVAVAAPDDIDALITRLSTLSSAVSEAVDEADQEEEAEITDLRASAQDAPVIKLVYSILGQAANEGASDIHFEPGEDDMRVRFRVDGVLREAAQVPKRMVLGVVSRIKIMSELDIAEKRVPQDGRVSVNVEDRRVDLRVTTLPTQRGEGAAIRILDKSNAVFSLDELGLGGEARARFEAAFRQSYGAVLVTGPTGSGKSTTLYAALQELNEIEKNIITIEDPVEYRLPGINQINVNRKAGLSFATGLRSILRADPDIIMVGEVRDAETARIAIEAALTGHMVLTTLHTNDAPGAVIRLAKMGIEAFLTASAVDCVIAQRLARRLCSHCKRGSVMPQAVLEESGFSVDSDLEVYEPVGCARCMTSGYRGRVGLFSVMVMSDRIKDLAVSLAPEAELAQVAREEGMLTLKEDGLSKVRAGLTSIEEVARVAT